MLACLVFLLGVAMDIVLIRFVGGDGNPPSQQEMMAMQMHAASNLPRLACLVLWWPALTVLFAALHKIDLVLYCRGQRLLRPWEVDDDEGEAHEGEAHEADKQSFSLPILTTRGHRHQASTSSTLSRIDPLRKASLQPLGPRNDPDGEPWAQRQRRTPLYRRLWAEIEIQQPPKAGIVRTVAVQHSGVQEMQTQAVWTAVAWAGLTSATLTLASLFIPGPGM